MLARHIYKSFSKQKPCFIHHRNAKIKGNSTVVDYFDTENFLNKLSNKTECIIHTAGMTNVEKCEKNKNKTKKINFKLTKNLVEICKKKNFFFIYISSDHLYDGNSIKGYSEKSYTNPLNYYAKTKVFCEDYIKKKLKKFLIIRTNFFGKGNKFKKSFSDKILLALRKKKKINLFDDVYFNPISMNELSLIIRKLYEKKKVGTFNISTNEKISKYEFGLYLAKYYHFDKKLIIKKNINFKNLTKRPKNMYLKNSKIKKIIKFKSKLLDNIKFA